MPFLAGVALLFRGYNSLRNLKIMYPVEVVRDANSSRTDTIYHKVETLPLFDVKGDSLNFEFTQDNYLVTRFTLGDLAYARKQITYLSNLLDLHSGIKIVVLFQGEKFYEFLIEDDMKLLSRKPRLNFFGFSNENSDKVLRAFYPEGFNEEEYSLVDINGHIRAQFNIEDARDVKKRKNLLKLLDLEFPEKKIKTVEQIKE